MCWATRRVEQYLRSAPFILFISAKLFVHRFSAHYSTLKSTLRSHTFLFLPDDDGYDEARGQYVGHFKENYWNGSAVDPSDWLFIFPQIVRWYFLPITNVPNRNIDWTLFR
jgi:hypothetical protein